MPTKREREYYRMGFDDGIRSGRRGITVEEVIEYDRDAPILHPRRDLVGYEVPKKKRKLSAWNKYVKNKRNHITYRDGKLNLKKMAVAFRRKKRR